MDTISCAKHGPSNSITPSNLLLYTIEKGVLSKFLCQLFKRTKPCVATSPVRMTLVTGRVLLPTRTAANGVCEFIHLVWRHLSRHNIRPLSFRRLCSLLLLCDTICLYYRCHGDWTCAVL